MKFLPWKTFKGKIIIKDDSQYPQATFISGNCSPGIARCDQCSTIHFVEEVNVETESTKQRAIIDKI